MKKIISILIITCLFVSSCSDILDLTPLDKYTDETVWQEPSLVEMFVNGRYSELRNPFSEMIAGGSDECYQEAAQAVVRGEITPDNAGGGAYNMWNKAYTSIRNCNVYMSKIEGVPFTDLDKKKRLTAEVRFIRAFQYYELIRRYGGVPLLTEPFDLSDNMEAARASYDQCVEFITSEIEEAITGLPFSYSAGELSRITKGAAMALKADILLHAASALWNTGNDVSKWNAALQATDELLNLTDNNGTKLYSLHPVAATDVANGYARIFQYTSSDIVSNPEAIFYRVYSSINYTHSGYDGANDVDLFNSPAGYGGYSLYAPVQEIVDAFETADGKKITDNTAGYDSQNPYVNRDPRFYANILYNDAEFRGRNIENWLSEDGQSGGRDSSLGAASWNSTKTGYNMRKWMNESLDFTQGKSTTCWLYFRYTKFLLNKIECLIALGGTANEQTAIQLLNEIRNRVTMPPLSSQLTGSELTEAYRQERKIELLFEEDRFFDVRRWKIAETELNKPVTGVTAIKKTDGSFEYLYYNATNASQVFRQERKFLTQHYLMPIPADEMRKVNFDNNPGY